MADWPRDRVVLVTGAASGIGRATALAAARGGANGVTADVDKAGLAALAEAASGCSGQVLTSTADVSRAADCEGLVEAAVAQFGGLDVLANVAGVQIPNDRVETLAEADWDRVLAVNLKSVFLLSRAAIPALRRRGGAAIVSVSSVHAFASMGESAAYAASKGALVALTRQMAIDLAPDLIRVVAVAPGSVDTPMTRRAVERLGRPLDELGFSTDPRRIGRVGQPDEVAAVVLWLASPGAGFVNGTTLAVDGGLLGRL